MKFFTCTECDRKQLAWSRDMRNGLTEAQAKSSGWYLVFGESLCPFCAKVKDYQLAKEKMLYDKDKRLREIEQLRTERIEELEQLAKDERSKDAKKGSKKKKG